MRPMLRTVFGVLALGLLLVQPVGLAGASARMQQAPSSRVALDVPEGYVASPLFSGFVNEETGASFVVVEMPAEAYDQVVKGMTAEALAAKGIKKAQPGKIDRPEPYLYITAEQASPKGDFAKFMLIFRDVASTALVTANVPKAALDEGAIKPADIAKVLASAELTSVPAPAREVFVLDYLGPFKAAGTMLGTTRAYTLDGRLEPPKDGETQAILIVAPALDKRPVPASEAYAEKLLEGLEGIKGAKIDQRQAIKVAGLDGVELTATAKDKDSGAEIFVYQALVLPPNGGYYRLVGQMPVAMRAELLPELRKVTAGFRPLE